MAPTARIDGSKGALRHHDLGGISYLERSGNGPTLMFLHGIGSNSDTFAPLLERFPEGPRLIAWNAPGYLSSEPLAAAAPTAQDYAASLERFFDNLGLETAHVVGHSLGTLIAAAFALRTPDRVASIVLAASAQGHGIAAGEALPQSAASRLDDLAAQGSVAFANARAPRLVFEPERNPSVLARVRDQMARINPGGYAQAVHMLASGNLAASVAGLRQKPAFIVGAEDLVTPIDQTNAAIHRWADAHGDTPRCITIARAGHAIYVQDPDAFAAALIELVPELESEMPRYAEGEPHG